MHIARFFNAKTRTLFLRFFLPLGVVAYGLPRLSNFLLEGYAQSADGIDANAFFLSESINYYAWAILVPALFVWTWFGLKRVSTEQFFSNALTGWKFGLLIGAIFFATNLTLSAINPGLIGMNPTGIYSANLGEAVASALIQVAICVLLIGWSFNPRFSELTTMFVVAIGYVLIQLFYYAKLPSAPGIPKSQPISNFLLPSSLLIMTTLLGRRKGLGATLLFLAVQTFGFYSLYLLGYLAESSIFNRLVLLAFPIFLFRSKSPSDYE